MKEKLKQIRSWAQIVGIVASALISGIVAVNGGGDLIVGAAIGGALNSTLAAITS